MNRLALLFFLVFFTAIAAFGQSPWMVKPFPYASNSLSAIPDFGSSKSKGLGDDLLTGHRFARVDKDDPFGWKDFNKGTRLVLPVKVALAQWNMPILDLSMGFSSNLPIKSSFGDVSSQMPIAGEAAQLPESGLRNVFEATPPLFPGGAVGASLFKPGR